MSFQRTNRRYRWVAMLILPVLAMLLAILAAIPLSGMAAPQAPPGGEPVLVNADREFVERTTWPSIPPVQPAA